MQELDEEEDDLNTFLEFHGYDMAAINRNEMRKKIKALSMDPTQQALRQEVDAKLEKLRPVARDQPIELSLENIGARLANVNRQDEDDDADLHTVDVLDPTAKPFPRDKPADALHFYDEQEDRLNATREDTEDVPVASQLTGAEWLGRFRYNQHLVKTLKDYQRSCTDFLLHRVSNDAGALVAHGMGLGKTLTTLAYLEVYSHANPQTRAIVCCPKSMVGPWMDEVLFWRGKQCITMDAMTVRSNDQELATKVWTWKRHGGVLIIGHDQFKITYAAGHLPIDSKTIVVVDEAHLLKTPSTQMHDTIAGLPTMRRVFLTGTPMQNNLTEFFTMVHLLDPGLLGDNVGKFNQHYAHKIERGMQRDSSPETVAESERYVEMLRWKLQNVMHDRSAAIHLSCIDKCEFRVLHPSNPVVKNPSWIKERHNVHDASLEQKVRLTVALLDAIHEEGDDSVVVFSSRVNILERLQDEHPGVGVFKGDVQNESHRRKLVNDFKAAPSSVIYITKGAGGVGINLSHGNRVILVDASWNPAEDAQAVARCFRLGQSKAVFVYRLIAEGTLEEGMYRLNVKKQNLTARILDEHEMLRIYNRDDVMQYVNEEDQESLVQEDIRSRDNVLFLAMTEAQKDPMLNPVKIKNHDELFSDASVDLPREERAQAVNEFNFENRNGTGITLNECYTAEGTLVPAKPPVFEQSDDGIIFKRCVDFLNDRIYINLVPTSPGVLDVVHAVFYRNADGGDWIHVTDFNMPSAGTCVARRGDMRKEFDPKLSPGTYEFCTELRKLRNQKVVSTGERSQPSAPIMIA